MGAFETFCPRCDAKVLASTENRTESIEIRGERIEYNATVPVCPLCGIAIGDSRMESKNLDRAYRTYRLASSARGATALLEDRRDELGLDDRRSGAFHQN